MNGRSSQLTPLSGLTSSSNFAADRPASGTVRSQDAGAGLRTTNIRRQADTKKAARKAAKFCDEGALHRVASRPIHQRRLATTKIYARPVETCRVMLRCNTLYRLQLSGRFPLCCRKMKAGFAGSNGARQLTTKGPAAKCPARAFNIHERNTSKPAKEDGSRGRSARLRRSEAMPRHDQFDPRWCNGRRG